MEPVHTYPTDDPGALARTLAPEVARASSVEEFAGRLAILPGVDAVSVADHLVKTEPPRREVTARFAGQGTAAATWTIDVVIAPDGSLRLSGIHPP